jgi:hypothetical protein
MSDHPLPNAKDLRRRYGLSLDQYVELLDAQGGVCAICGKPPKGRPLVPDHDHDTLAIDGLVHWSPCNRWLPQSVRRYLADPPGRRFGWTVPAELEARTIARREAGKAEARARRAEQAEAKRREAERLQRARLDRIEAMTRPSPDQPLDQDRTSDLEDFAERTERALAATAASPRYGWAEPPRRDPEPELAIEQPRRRWWRRAG